LVKEASGAKTTSTYDLANQLETSRDANGTTTYTYDQAGNLSLVESPTGDRTTTTWDDQNRQTTVTQPDNTVTTCTYKSDGLRHSKEDTAGLTNFLWDDQRYLADQRPAVAGTDDQNEIQAVYTNEPQQYGNLISQYRKGPTIWTPSYYQYDALGSTRALTDDIGDATDTYLYDAWGNEIDVTGSTLNPFRWVGDVGYYWDGGTGTFYIRARVYEPVRGRWMSQDPLFYPEVNESLDRGFGEVYVHMRNGHTFDPFALAADNLNAFRYAFGAPIHFLDAAGTFATEIRSLEPEALEPCAKRTRWDSTMCNECPPCTCAATAHGRAKISPNFPIMDFWGRKIQEEMGGFPEGCTVYAKIGDCGIPNISFACPKGQAKGKRDIYICISKDYTRCQAKILLHHELVHAKQFCNQKNGPAGYDARTCRDFETPAWKVQCEMMSEHDCCVAQRGEAKCAREIAACIKQGVEVTSCGPIRASFFPCSDENLGNVFPNAVE
jgi:RHS repeat-associated protein